MQVVMFPSMISQKLLLAQCWPSYRDTFSSNRTDTHLEFVFVSSVFKALKEHMSDFQKLVSSLGQRYSVVYHTDLTSMYIRQWQVKLAHTRFNPLFSSHSTLYCNHLESHEDLNPKYSEELCCTSNSWKKSSTVLPFLPAAQAQKPHHGSATQYSHVALLWHIPVLLHWGRGVVRISASIFGSPTRYLFIHPAHMNLVLTTI